MDIVIPLGKGSRCGDLELKYCLRSIERYLPNVGAVIIVGELPQWEVRNIHWLACPESNNNQNRALNICTKVLKACQDLPLSDDFLFMNDDHFLLQEYSYYFPYYHRGTFNLSRLSNNPSQLNQVRNTINRLGNRILDYDIHCPIVYNKTNFIQTFSTLGFPPYGYCIKSYYMAYNKRHSLLAEDLKFLNPLPQKEILAQLKGREWFSTGDAPMVRGEMIKALDFLYPYKSKYEN